MRPTVPASLAREALSTTESSDTLDVLRLLSRLLCDERREPYCPAVLVAAARACELIGAGTGERPAPRGTWSELATLLADVDRDGWGAGNQARSRRAAFIREIKAHTGCCVPRVYAFALEACMIAAR